MEAVPIQRKRKCCSLKGKKKKKEITSKPSVQASSPVASYLITAARVLTWLMRPQESSFCSFLPRSAAATVAGVHPPKAFCLERSSRGELHSYLLHFLQAPCPRHLIAETFHDHSTDILRPTTTTTNSTFLLVLFYPVLTTHSLLFTCSVV